jgi:general secretion pathway protein A
MYPPSDDSLQPASDAPAAAAGTSASFTYEPFYGLREKPFSLSTDPRFLYRSPSHGPAFDALLAGIRRREGLIVLTGEIGTGKTTLCRSVLQHLDRRTFAAFVPDPFVSREDLLKTLLVDFGVISVSEVTRGRFSSATRSALSYLLYEFLDSLVPLQAFAVLVIDETQNLSLPLLEEVRILSELERREKLLQVVLVGQPELRSSLRLPQMRQVDQRISVRCELAPLDADGVTGYVHHRLLVAGLGESRVEFTRAALDAVGQGSAGVPRVINRVCDRALERAFAARSLCVDAEIVWDAIEDLGHSRRIQDRSKAERPTAPEPVVDAASRPTPLESVPIFDTHAENASSLLEDFASEVTADAPAPTATARSSPRPQWAAVAAASILAVMTAAGVPAWYLHAQTIDERVFAALPLPPAPRLHNEPAVMPLDMEPIILSPSAGEEAAAAAPAPAGGGGGYTIVVASFASRARAERLVEELTSAGFRARVVERDWGPPRGRLLQVNVGDYASAIDVQRDLQHIRELPGGYTDARIVERD